MGRGLDGFFDARVALCSFEGPGAAVSRRFPVALARGKHLFPFRTEQLSPSAPMVLGPRGPGRVGRRRFFLGPSFRAARPCRADASVGGVLDAAAVAEATRDARPVSR